MYNSHNHIFECIKPGRRERERGNGEQSSRGVGWVGTMAAVNSRDKNRLEKRSSRRAWCTFGRHFLFSASARCAVAHVRLRWRRRRRLVAVSENFLFSSLAWQLGLRKGVCFMEIVQPVKKLNSISRAPLNFRRQPILCTTLYRNPTQASNFGGAFGQLFLWIFLWHFHRRCFFTFSIPWCKKVKKMTKNSKQGVLP